MNIRSLILLFLLASSSLAFAQALQTVPMDTAIRYGKLSNGLTYYIRHNEQPKERADFFIAQNVGAILEEDAQNGLAHFLEHMCFNGTRNFPGKNLLNYFESIGVKFGQNINAYTSLDETVYNLSEIPTKTREGILDSALLALHDWSSFVLLQDDEIDKERGVIREEWRQGRTAQRRLMEKRNEVMLAGSKYAIRTVIGDTAVINNFTYDELRAYYKKWYRPDLQAILVVGDVDVDQIESKIKSIFSDIPAPVNPAERTWFKVSENQSPIVGVFTDPEMTSQQILIFWKKPALANNIRNSVQGYALGRANDLISAMTSERLSNITMEPNSPISGAAAGITDLVRTEDAYMFQFAPVNGKEKEARARILKEIEVIRKFGFTETELERAKTGMLSSFEKSNKEKDQQKNTSLIREYVRNFTESEPIPGISWENKFVQELLPTIPLQSINQLVATYLPQKNMVLTITGPEKENIAYPSNDELLSEIKAVENLDIKPYLDSTSNEPLISKLPKKGRVKKNTKNEDLGTTEWTLSNGIKVILKPTKFKEDEISMSAWSNGGLSLIPVKDLISATLAGDIISQSGIGKFKLSDLQKKLAGKIVSISPIISNYEELMSGSSSVKDQETLLQLTYLYFTSPRKDTNTYNLMMKQLITYLENTENNPQKAYSDSLNLITYNYNPRISILTNESIKKIDMNTAHRIYSERFANPADFVFTFVGNIDLATFQPLIEKYLGSLSTSKKKESWKDNNLRIQKGLIRKDITKKLQVSKTTNNIRYTAEMPFNITNSVNLSALADILDLRYTATMREEEGATYGVSVSGAVSVRPIPTGTLSIRFDTDPKLEEKMLGIIHSELDTLAQRGPLPEDMNKVKLNLKKQYSEDIAENGWWMSVINRYYRDHVNYVTHYEKAIDALNGEHIKKIANQILESKNRLVILLQPE